MCGAMWLSAVLYSVCSFDSLACCFVSDVMFEPVDYYFAPPWVSADNIPLVKYPVCHLLRVSLCHDLPLYSLPRPSGAGLLLVFDCYVCVGASGASIGQFKRWPVCYILNLTIKPELDYPFTIPTLLDYCFHFAPPDLISWIVNSAYLRAPAGEHSGDPYSTSFLPLAWTITGKKLKPDFL